MEWSVSRRLVVLLGLLGALGCGSSDGAAPDGGTGAAPSIDSFTATPATIQSGASSTLAWTVRNATSIALDGAAVTGSSSVVSPTATATYTLTATNSAGTTTATATVTVSAASTVPTDPIPFTKDTVFTLDSGTTNWVVVRRFRSSSGYTAAAGRAAETSTTCPRAERAKAGSASPSAVARTTAGTRTQTRRRSWRPLPT